MNHYVTLITILIILSAVNYWIISQKDRDKKSNIVTAVLIDLVVLILLIIYMTTGSDENSSESEDSASGTESNLNPRVETPDILRGGASNKRQSRVSEPVGRVISGPHESTKIVKDIDEISRSDLLKCHDCKDPYESCVDFCDSDLPTYGQCHSECRDFFKQCCR